MAKTTVLGGDNSALVAELRSLYATAPVGLCSLDTDLRYIHVNQRLAAMNGLPVGAHIGRSVREVAPALADILEPIYRDSLTTGLPVRDFEISPVLAGEPEVGRIWLASCQPARDDTDEVIGLNVVVQDITDRKRTETALRAARETVSQRDAFLHVVADRLPRAFVYRVIHSPDGSFVFTYLSKGVEAVAGLTAEDLFREPTLLTERIIDEDRQPFIDAMTKSLTDFTPFDFACRLRWADGSVHWNHFRSAVRPLDDGTLACEGLMLDVTAQKHAEEALLDSQARNDAILSAIPDIMFLQTLDGVYLDAHVGDPRLLLVPKDIFLGRSMHEVLPPHMAEAFSACFRRVAAEGSAVHEYPLELSGEERHFEARMVRCGTDRVLTIVRDVTENRRALHEAQLSRAELARVSRLSMLGEITASLAHELNQPLATILANAQAAERQLAGSHTDLAELQTILADIVEADQRAGQVIRRMRAWLNRDAPSPQPLDLGAVILEVEHLMRSEIIRRQAQVSVHLAESLPPVLADRVQIQQVLINLVLNALEAMQDLPVDDRRLRIDAAQVGPAVQVSVRDHGTGVRPDHLQRVFDPFFTTKPTGLGIGLRICSSIVSSHHGRIWVTNNEGSGATFSFTLPPAPP